MPIDRATTVYDLPCLLIDQPHWFGVETIPHLLAWLEPSGGCGPPWIDCTPTGADSSTGRESYAFRSRRGA